MTATNLRKTGVLFAATALLVVVAAIVLWQLAASSPAAAGAKPASQAAKFGFPAAVQAKIDRLNADLDDCLLANGADRLPLGANGWTYTDPGGRPSAACVAVQARVNAYANSAEMRAAVASVMPAVEAYSRCLEKQGVSRASHGASVSDQATRARAHVACGGTEADAVPAG